MSGRNELWGIEQWRPEAACQDLDPDLFFPVGSTGPAVDQIERATAVCAGCTVRTECLEFALATNQEYGVWGGTSEDERRPLRRAWRARQRAAARPSAVTDPVAASA